VAAGTPVVDQVAGDCHVAVCDGAGGTEESIDDDDVPDDDNDCTADSCQNGVEQHEALSVGSACGNDGVCDDDGNCVGCNSPADCPGTDSECSQRICVNQQCDVAFEAQGTPLAIQPPGDCKLEQCDGNGGTESINDDSDPFDDSNDCTADTCNAGTPVNTPTPGASCGVGLVCDANGACAGCTVPSDCGADDFCKTRTCVNNTCGINPTADGTPLPQQTAGDCKVAQCDGAGNSEVIADDNDKPVDGLECTNDVCTNGAPSNPPKSVGTACNGGSDVCTANGQCVDCNSPADCPATPNACTFATCNGNSCGTSNSPSGTVCGTPSCTGGTQQAAALCNGSGTCQPGASASCAPYVCGATACTTSCVNNTGCSSGNTCDTGIARCSAAGAPKCTEYCNTIAANCTQANGNPMYPGTPNCLNVCKTLPLGNVGDVGGQSVGCRLYHGGAPSVGDPNAHCPHAGPAAEGQCGNNCDSFCIIAQATCTGANQSFPSMNDCMTACGGFPINPVYDATVTSGNSFACRMYHLTAAAVDPSGHCSHIKAVSPTCQ
jgi:hypothetical protein